MNEGLIACSIVAMHGSDVAASVHGWVDLPAGQMLGCSKN
jgi:hypothetical protein